VTCPQSSVLSAHSGAGSVVCGKIRWWRNRSRGVFSFFSYPLLSFSWINRGLEKHNYV